LLHRLEYYLFVTITALLHRLPEKLCIRLAKLIGRLGHRTDSRHRRVALSNLKLAFPELDSRSRRQLTRRCFENFACTLIDSLVSAPLDRESYLQRLDYDGWEFFEQAERAGHGVLMMTGHLGNWEACGQSMALKNRPLLFVARPLDNPLIETRIRRIRERFGNTTVPKRGGAGQILRSMKGGGFAGMLIDQRVHPDEGKAYDFFGHPAYTTPLLARLSLRTGAPVVPFFGIPAADWGRTRIVFRPPIFPDAELENTVDQLTIRYLAAIEEEIRRYPELWLWMHRRWRESPINEPQPDGPHQVATGPANAR
jgi:KDO2-lipid IV(A) lauroyltransferase